MNDERMATIQKRITMGAICAKIVRIFQTEVQFSSVPLILKNHLETKNSEQTSPT